MEPRLSRIRIAGFRSLREVELTLGPLTVLIGPNGAGKSNLLWALELTRLLAHQGLQRFVGACRIFLGWARNTRIGR